MLKKIPCVCVFLFKKYRPGFLSLFLGCSSSTTKSQNPRVLANNSAWVAPYNLLMGNQLSS